MFLFLHFTSNSLLLFLKNIFHKNSYKPSINENLLLLAVDVHGDPAIRKYPPDGGGEAREPPPGGTSGTRGAISADYDLLTLDIPRQQILIGAR